MKKFILCLVLLFPIIVGAENFQIQEFSGLVDIVEPDLLTDKYSPDLLNVLTDEYACLTKRRGSTQFLSSPLSDLHNIRTIYPYSQQNGNAYMIIESSTSIYYSLSNGSPVSITNGISSSYRYSFMTAKDVLYGSNGSNNPFYSSPDSYTELTVANSTGMVKARFITYWNNRAWYAGVDNYRSTVYYSEYNDPTNIQAVNYLNINVSDGDNITGLYKTSDNKLKIFKTYSTWEIYEKSAGVFDFRNISQTIGCLYQTTIDEKDGNMYWLSHRGVEKYDGTFTLVSSPIDNFIKSLNQIKVNQASIVLNTAGDWGAGTGTNIDTTTTAGSVEISNPTDWQTQRYWSDVCMSTDGTKQMALVIGGYVYYSTNTGNTFSVGYGATTLNPRGCAMSADGTKRAFVDGYYIATSVDSGYSYSYKYFGSYGSTALYDVAISTDGTRITVIYSLGALVSTDSGANYTGHDMPLTNYTCTCVAMSGNGRIQLVGASNGSMYGSSDYGATWSATGVTGQPTNCTVIAINEAGDKPTVYGSGSSGVGVYMVNAINWYQVLSVSGVSGISMNSDASKQTVVCNSGDMYLTSNTGTTWTAQNQTRNWSDVAMSYTGNNFTAVVSPGRIYTSTTVVAQIQGSYTSAVQTASNWGSWSNIVINDYTPTDTAIEYFVKVSTASDNMASKSLISVSNGIPIPSTVGPYVQLISSFTIYSDIGAIESPRLDRFEIPFNSLSNNTPPIGKFFDDRYWLFVSTDATTNINNVALVYQKNGDWTVFNNIYAGSACIYKSNFYTGSSKEDGKIFRQDVPGVYSDDGGAYESYYCTKIFDCGSFASNKVFDSMWVSAKNSGNWSIEIGYRLDGLDSTWNSKTFSLLDAKGYITKKISFPKNEMNKGKYIQYRIRNSNANEPFLFKKLSTNFKILPPL
jgi:hypothetical protein